MVAWRIYYGDGSTYEEDPFFAPAGNVQIIVCEDASVGRLLHGKHDYYWWDTTYQRWFGGDTMSMWDYLRQPGPRRVLFGRSISTPDFDAILLRAVRDPDFPVKSARDPMEQV